MWVRSLPQVASLQLEAEETALRNGNGSRKGKYRKYITHLECSSNCVLDIDKKSF